MVLSASPPLGPLPARRWLDRLSGILALTAKGVLVLVEGGPERLGDLVRHLVGSHADLAVLTRAPELAELAPGSTAVLWLREQDFDWLNGARPVVQGQRVVLFGSAAVATALSQRAFDFYDWISHRLEAPAGPPAFAVRALQRAACARPAAIAWKGGDLEAAFAAAFPGRHLAQASAVEPYPGLVEALKPRPKTWVAVTGGMRPFDLRRVVWAAAEVGRCGRTILVEPRMGLTDLPSAHARPMSVEEATERLAASGVAQPARTAALLDLEPEAIALAAELAKAGAAKEDLEARTQSELDKAGRGRRPRWPRLASWPQRVERATAVGDLEVAERWATAWREEARDSTRATAALARVLALQGRSKEAEALLAELEARATTEPDDATRFEILRARGHSRLGEGSAETAARDLKQAIALAKVLGLPARTLSELHAARVVALLDGRKIQEAENALHTWQSEARFTPDAASSNPQVLRGCAAVLLAKGQFQEAAELAEQGLRALKKDEDDLVGERLAETLVHAWIELGRFADAERAAGAALRVVELRHRLTTSGLLYEHARALAGLGRFAEAEPAFRRVLADLPPETKAATVSRELARCLIALGRAGEAEDLVDQALALTRGASGDKAVEHAWSLHEKARLRGLAGDDESSATLFREALQQQERLFGRDEPSLALTLTEYAEVLTDLQRPREAIPLLRRALSITDPSADPISLATALTGLARAEAMQQLPQAAATARRALSAWSTAAQEVDPAVMDELDSLAAGDLPPPPLPASRPPRRARR
jgi:tetratricopeptide (TPR) repeat protein